MQLAPVGHPHGTFAFEHVADVLDLAAVGAARRLDVLRPAPARLERPPPDLVSVQVDELDLALAVFKLPDLVWRAELFALDLSHRSSFRIRNVRRAGSSRTLCANRAEPRQFDIVEQVRASSVDVRSDRLGKLARRPPR